MYKTNNSTHTGWNRMLCLLLVLLANLAQAQQGSWGNIRVHGDGRMTVFGAHSFGPGLITTQRTTPIGVVVFGPTATYSGANDASHVDGYVSKAGTAAFDFPVGSATKLRTIGISAPATSAQFRAAYWGTNPNPSFPVANLGTGVMGVSTTEYWELTGAQAVNVKLTWDAASGLNALAGGNLANLIVVGYNPATSKWESLGNAGGTTGTLAAAGTITANGVTPDTYSAFTFASANAVTTPDLRPFITMLAPTFTATTVTRPFSVRVRNMRDNTTATDPVTIRVYKPTSTSTITLTGASVGVWTIANSGLYFTLTTNTDIPAGATGSVITANLTIPATAASGDYQFRSFIPDLSGGEVVADNGNNNVYIQVVKN